MPTDFFIMSFSGARRFVLLQSMLLVICSLPAVAQDNWAEVNESPASEPADVYDPWEGFNRSIFWFNDQVDIYLLEPVASGYDFIVPGPAQTGIDNFFKNIRTPIYLVSDLVQFKFKQFGLHSGRFLINSTLGVAGFIDVAQYMSLEEHYEDFGTALGYRGVPSGPYLVIPFLGPSNIRDAFGRIVDAFLNPTFYTGVVLDDFSDGELLAVSGGLYLLDSVNTRARVLEDVETAKEASLDYYLFVRSAYGQLRANQIYDNSPPGVVDEFEDGYIFEDEEGFAEDGDEAAAAAVDPELPADQELPNAAP